MLDDFTAAIDAARTLASVDDIARGLWRAYQGGAIDDADAGRVSAQIEEARRRIRPASLAKYAGSISPSVRCANVV